MCELFLQNIRLKREAIENLNKYPFNIDKNLPYKVKGCILIISLFTYLFFL